jgi:hypothetical protein
VSDASIACLRIHAVDTVGLHVDCDPNVVNDDTTVDLLIHHRDRAGGGEGL